MSDQKTRRILVIDDNQAIHADFRKILVARPESDLDRTEAALFSTESDTTRPFYFELDSAHQGEEGLAKLCIALHEGRPYAVAFVDMRMPPGWDGVQTILRLWDKDPDLQVVICTAYADYTWSQILDQLGVGDRLLILKKPFDNAEVSQIACALSEKWHLAKLAKLQMDDLEGMIQTRTVQLQCTNTKLESEIVEHRRSEHALLDSEERFRNAFDNASIGMALVAPDGRWLKVNHALCGIVGYSEKDLLASTCQHITYKDDLEADLQFVRQMLASEIQTYEMEKRYIHRNGHLVWVLLSVSMMRDRFGEAMYFISQVQDITKRKAAEDKLRHDAFHDTLTGLANRALLIERIGQCMAYAARNQEYRFAVLFLDLDRFKVVNDSLGHLIGDELLMGIAARLTGCIRTLDTVARVECPPNHIARVGGDEFLLLLDDLRDPEGAIRVADRIQEALAVPFNLHGHEIVTTASIGIAMSNSHYERAEDLLRDADTALYHAKSLGKARCEMFDRKMHADAMARLQLECELRHAIEHNELFLEYQPIISLSDGHIAGFEALARWNHPRRGLISPAEFIPVAEETGLVVPLGYWAIREACSQLTAWQRQFPQFHELSMRVNVSIKQFAKPDMVNQIQTIVRETGIRPECLKLEITETDVMENATLTIRGLLQLKELNLQLHLDDFGMGYSSLSYLQQLPIDALKIDRSFIDKLGTDAGSSVIVDAIVGLAHSLNLSVIAEGVETEAHLVRLLSIDCHYAQGYFFSRPVKPEDVTALLCGEHAWLKHCRAGALPMASASDP